MEKMVIEGSRTVTFADRHTVTERRSSSSCSGSSTTELLEVACKEVDYQLVSDRKYPELATQLGLTSHGKKMQHFPPLFVTLRYI